MPIRLRVWSHVDSERRSVVPIRVVQEWLGHADISMKMRYAHLSPDGQGGMIDRLLD